MLKLLHTADWQVGRVFAQFDEDDAAALFEARFRVVERLAAIAAAQGVDAVLVAGDVFDAQTVADKTVRRLFNAMAGFAGPWILLPGNHDAALSESVWSRAGRLGAVPPNVIPCLAPESVVVADRFALLPAPLTQRHTYNDLTDWFQAAATPAGLPRIGLAHGCVQGVLAPDIDSANPIAADRAAAAGLDYLALGDWHGTRRIDERTWYAGTPETDRFRGNDSGQALLVSLPAAGAVPQVEVLATGEYRWLQQERTLVGPSDVDAAVQMLAALDAGAVLDLRVAGNCDLAGHGRLLAAVEAARARVRALVFNAQALRLEPTEEDIHALQADGYVGDVLAQLRTQQQAAPDPVARDALLALARILAAQRAGARA